MIPVRNVYYMLSYAYQVLNKQGYRDVATENFHNVADLCAMIMCEGVSRLIKQGLGRDYIPHTEATSLLKGKIEISESVRTRSMLKSQMVCTYDEFSVNSYFNRIIKSTMELLLKADIDSATKKKLRKLYIYFADVESIDIHNINWKQQYNRNNQNYRMLVAICYLVVKGLLQSREDGTTKLMDYVNDKLMYHLYERFILEYYKREFPQLEVHSQQVPWDLDDGYDEALPIMQTDITLKYQDKVLIIDAKYYTHNLQQQYGKSSIISGNLYQIFTYVKNMDASYKDSPKTVSGMLMYAKTDDNIQLTEKVYHMSGNQITVRTLDLECDFADIAEQLNSVVKSHFGISIGQ